MVNKKNIELSRYQHGVVTINHKGVKVTTSVGTNMDDVIETMDDRYKFKLGKVPVMFANRPDNISDLFYDSPKYWWFIMQFNGFDDPFEFLNSGDDIKIPEL